MQLSVKFQKFQEKLLTSVAAIDVTTEGAIEAVSCFSVGIYSIKGSFSFGGTSAVVVGDFESKDADFDNVDDFVKVDFLPRLDRLFDSVDFFCIGDLCHVMIRR